jgi:predicted lipid-binding transport protein (Tim44 family)
MPRFTPSGEGAVFGPHAPVPSSGGSSPTWIIYAALAVLGLIAKALSRDSSPSEAEPRVRAPGRRVPAPPAEDVIFGTSATGAKAQQTLALLEFLARRHPQCEPAALRAHVTDTFRRVQQAWEQRDYGPVRDLLLPDIRDEHEARLRQMREHHEINRIEGLRIERLEFVRVSWPKPGREPEVAALITFEATVSFVDDRTGARTRGLPRTGKFQEFWVFRWHRKVWRLQDIERTPTSGLLESPNHVAERGEEQRNPSEQLPASQPCEVSRRI